MSNRHHQSPLASILAPFPSVIWRFPRSLLQSRLTRNGLQRRSLIMPWIFAANRTD
ncbi:hypothetical protein LINPERPRIM_LOCUS35549 [Linum perenne]